MSTSPMKKPVPTRPNVNVIWARCGAMTAHHDAQRIARKPIKVKFLIDNWDDRKVGALIGNLHPDGSITIDDGGTRWEAALAKFGPDYELPIVLNKHLSQNDEVEVFVGTNSDRTAVPKWDIFKRGMDAGMEPYASIEVELGKRGLGAAQKATPNRIGAVTSLARIYNAYGLERLGVATDVLTEAFTRTAETWNGDMLQAVAKLISEKEVKGRVIKDNATVVDLKRLVKVLGNHSIAQWSTLSLTGSGGSESRANAIARTIASEYNNRLSDTKKLYLPAPITRVP